MMPTSYNVKSEINDRPHNKQKGGVWTKTQDLPQNQHEQHHRYRFNVKGKRPTTQTTEVPW